VYGNGFARDRSLNWYCIVSDLLAYLWQRAVCWEHYQISYLIPSIVRIACTCWS